ncbi:hypothetical protein ACPA1H_18150 [Ectopseudomonas chengduensis]
MTAENHVFPDFDPSWSVQEAVEALGEDSLGPMTPLARWAAWGILMEYRARFEAGDKQVLFAALRKCACHDLPMPDWLADAYCKAHDDWVSYRKPTLDAAFDVAIPKGTHINKLKKLRSLKLAIPLKVQELCTDQRPIDESLFNDVGKIFNISGSQARDIYYKYRWRKDLQKK